MLKFCVSQHADTRSKYVSFCKNACDKSQRWHMSQVQLTVFMAPELCYIVDGI